MSSHLAPFSLLNLITGNVIVSNPHNSMAKCIGPLDSIDVEILYQETRIQILRDLRVCIGNILHLISELPLEHQRNFRLFLNDCNYTALLTQTLPHQLSEECHAYMRSRLRLSELDDVKIREYCISYGDDEVEHESINFAMGTMYFNDVSVQPFSDYKVLNHLQSYRATYLDPSKGNVQEPIIVEKNSL